MNELCKQITVLAGQKNRFGMQTQISTTIDCLSVKPINSISVDNVNDLLAIYSSRYLWMQINLEQITLAFVQCKQI